MDNFQERFYQMVSRLKSRAASTPQEDVRITEMINGVLVSRSAKKYQEITNNVVDSTTSNEPKIIDLQDYAKSKAGSINGINKMKVINDFINHGRYH